MKACWSVRLSSGAPFALVGAASNRAEALASARLIWPEADVE